MYNIEEEEDQLRQVISHKKNEFRVEIRKKKVQQDLQSKRFKIIHQSFSGLFNQNENDNQQEQEIFEQKSSNQLQNAIDNIQMCTQTEEIFKNVPDILQIEDRLTPLVIQLQQAWNMKDILACQDIIQVIYVWVIYYIKYKELLETRQALNLMINQKIHIFCTRFIANRYLENSEIQLHSYVILAQLSAVIDQQPLAEMEDNQLYTALIETLQNQNNPKIIDHLFHVMANFAGDINFGSNFCLELVNRDIIAKSVDILQKFNEKQLDILIDSYLFFLQNFIKGIPKVKRNQVNELLPILMLILPSYKQIKIRKYCINCLRKIIKYDNSSIDIFGEEDYWTLGQLIYENPKISEECLGLLNQIVMHGSNKIVQKLVENHLLTSLVKVLESGVDKNRFTAAFILSNISGTPDQSIQDEILEDLIYKPIMKSLCNDNYKIKMELGMFLVNLILCSSFETMIILIEKKHVFHFLLMIIQQFNNEIELILFCLKAYQYLVETLSLRTDSSKFVQYLKQIGEIGLLKEIESLTENPNQEIRNLAEHIYSRLEDNNLINQNEFDIQPPRQKNMVVSFQNSRNQVAGQQTSSNNKTNIFMKQLESEYHAQNQIINNNLNFNNFQQNRIQDYNQSNNSSLQISNLKNQMIQE